MITETVRNTEAWAGARLWLLDPRVLILDRNPRLIGDVETDRAQLVDSIREHGVLQPILADAEHDPCDPDGVGELHVRDGHCRTLAAIVTGKAEVPVIVAAHADAESYELRRDQYLGNQCRAGLNSTEQAAVLGELTLFGLSAADIAAQLSTDTATVESGLAVHRSQAAKDTLAEYPQLSLAQAGAVAEMTEAGDTEAIAELEEVVAEDPAQVDHAIARWRHDQAARAAVAEAAAELQAAGVVVFANSQEARQAAALPLYRLDASSEDHARLSDEPEAHAGCPGRAAVVTARWDGQVHTDEWCATPTEAGHTDLWAGSFEHSRPQGGQKSEAEKAEMRRVRARNSEWRAAQDVRRAFVTNLLARKQAPKQAGQFLAAVLTAGDHELIKALERHDYTLACELAGFEHKPGRENPLAKGLSRASAGTATLRSLAVVLGAYEQAMDVHTWRNPTPGAKRYLAQLQAWGYATCHVENLALGQAEDTGEWPHLTDDDTDDEAQAVTEPADVEDDEEAELDTPGGVTDDEFAPDEERDIVDVYLPDDQPEDPASEGSAGIDAAAPGVEGEGDPEDGRYSDDEPDGEDEPFGGEPALDGPQASEVDEEVAEPEATSPGVGA